MRTALIAGTAVLIVVLIFIITPASSARSARSSAARSRYGPADAGPRQ